MLKFAKRVPWLYLEALLAVVDDAAEACRREAPADVGGDQEQVAERLLSARGGERVNQHSCLHRCKKCSTGHSVDTIDQEEASRIGF